MVFLKLQLHEGRPCRSLQYKGSQAGAWEPAKNGLFKVADILQQMAILPDMMEIYWVNLRVLDVNIDMKKIFR